MPVSNFKGLKTMAARCGIPLPAWLGALFKGLEREPGARQLIASALAAEMCVRLTEEGFGDLHFYTLNRPAHTELVYAICRVLGARGEAAK
jgi:methylenetetrahydrofolate reductase (NADPH)